MHRLTAVAILLALMVGCGKKAANSSPEQAETPKGNTPNPPPADPSAGKPKEQLKALRPMAVIKTGFAPGSIYRHQVHLSADGSIAAVGLANQQKIQIWKVSAEPTKLKEITGVVGGLSPDGKKVMRYGKQSPDGKSPDVVDAETGALISTLEHKTFMKTSFATSDTLIGLTNGDSLEPKKPGVVFVREYNTATGKMAREVEIPVTAKPKSFDFFNQGKELAVGSRMENRVEFWDLKAGTKSREITLANSPPKPTSELPWFNFVVSQDGKRLALERDFSSSRLYDTKTGAEHSPKDFSQSYNNLLANRELHVSLETQMDSKTFVVTTVYQVFDVKKGVFVATIPLPKNRTSGDTLSANGNVMITEGENGDLTVWDLTQIP